MIRLTRNEELVLAAVQALDERNGYPPSYRELGEETGLSLGGVCWCIRRLEKAGKLVVNPRQARTLRLVKGGRE